MNLRKQKELAARALGVSKKRIRLNTDTPENKKSIKELISREGVKELIQEKTIEKLPSRGNSRSRANFIASQKKRGRRSGQGNRKGTANARFKNKKKWMIKIRGIRAHLKKLKEEGRLSGPDFRNLYMKSKGNFFRNKRHISLYMEQNKLLKEREVKTAEKKVATKKAKPKSEAKVGGKKE